MVVEEVAVADQDHHLPQAAVVVHQDHQLVHPLRVALRHLQVEALTVHHHLHIEDHTLTTVPPLRKTTMAIHIVTLTSQLTQHPTILITGRSQTEIPTIRELIRTHILTRGRIATHIHTTIGILCISMPQ